MAEQTKLPVAPLSKFGGWLAEEALSGRLVDARQVNARLASISEDDLSVGCLAWRQASNIQRLAGQPQHQEALESIRLGNIVATALHPARTSARRDGDRIHVEASNLLTTGVSYASHIVLEATTDEGPTALLVPSSLVTAVRRPTFVGLGGADNALIDIAGTVHLSAVIGRTGGATRVIDQPYEDGLTMGAVALGGARAVLRVIEMTVLVKYPADKRIGQLVADIAAADALVAATPSYAPTASLWSRAAKLAATTAATRACRTAIEILGAPTYAEPHPLVQLQRDLDGLAYQAPTNDGAAAAVAAGLQHFTNPTASTTRRTT